MQQLAGRSRPALDVGAGPIPTNRLEIADVHCAQNPVRLPCWSFPELMVLNALPLPRLPDPV